MKKCYLFRVFVLSSFDIFFKSLGFLIVYWRYLCQSGIREISPLISNRLGSLFLEPMFPVSARKPFDGGKL